MYKKSGESQYNYMWGNTHCLRKENSMQKVEKGQELHMMYVPIDELKPAEYNPRSWSDEATNQLKESLTRFGLVDACVVNKAPGRENIVIGGHFRLKVAKELGYTEVPVVYVNIPDREKEKELNLRLNRNTGEWDFNLLKQFDIDLLLDVGFDDKDPSAIWDDVLSIEDDDFDVEKAVAEVKVPKTKVGDLYQLGDHRLLCADSLDLGNVQRLVGSVQPDMLYFDPPYNISLDYNKGVSTNGKYGGQFTHDSKSRTEYKAFHIVIMCVVLTLLQRMWGVVAMLTVHMIMGCMVMVVILGL